VGIIVLVVIHISCCDFVVCVCCRSGVCFVGVLVFLADMCSCSAVNVNASLMLYRNSEKCEH
jgi:hypothetical protein